MPDHTHIGIRTEGPHHFMKAFRYPYNRYFNKKYGGRHSFHVLARSGKNMELLCREFI